MQGNCSKKQCKQYRIQMNNSVALCKCRQYRSLLTGLQQILESKNMLTSQNLLESYSKNFKNGKYFQKDINLFFKIRDQKQKQRMFLDLSNTIINDEKLIKEKKTLQTCQLDGGFKVIIGNRLIAIQTKKLCQRMSQFGFNTQKLADKFIREYSSIHKTQVQNSDSCEKRIFEFLTQLYSSFCQFMPQLCKIEQKLSNLRTKRSLNPKQIFKNSNNFSIIVQNICEHVEEISKGDNAQRSVKECIQNNPKLKNYEQFFQKINQGLKKIQGKQITFNYLSQICFIAQMQKTKSMFEDFLKEIICLREYKDKNIRVTKKLQQYGFKIQDYFDKNIPIKSKKVFKQDDQNLVQQYSQFYSKIQCRKININQNNRSIQIEQIEQIEQIQSKLKEISGYSRKYIERKSIGSFLSNLSEHIDQIKKNMKNQSDLNLDLRFKLEQQQKYLNNSQQNIKVFKETLDQKTKQSYQALLFLQQKEKKFQISLEQKYTRKQKKYISETKIQLQNYEANKKKDQIKINNLIQQKKQLNLLIQEKESELKSAIDLISIAKQQSRYLLQQKQLLLKEKNEQKLDLIISENKRKVKLFQDSNILKQGYQTTILKIIDTLRQSKKKEIKSALFMGSFHQTKKFKLNNLLKRPNLLTIIKFEDRIVVAFGSNSLWSKEEIEIGFLMKIKGEESTVFQLIKGCKSICWTDEKIIYGKSEIRISNQLKEVNSNLGSRNSGNCFDSGTMNYNDLLGSHNGRKAFISYEIFQLQFDEERLLEKKIQKLNPQAFNKIETELTSKLQSLTQQNELLLKKLEAKEQEYQKVEVLNNSQQEIIEDLSIQIDKYKIQAQDSNNKCNTLQKEIVKLRLQEQNLNKVMGELKKKVQQVDQTKTILLDFQENLEEQKKIPQKKKVQELEEAIDQIRLQNSALKNKLEYKINYFETEKISFSKELSKKNEELANILKKLSRQELLSKQYKDQLSKKEKEIQVLNKKVKEELENFEDMKNNNGWQNEIVLKKVQEFEKVIDQIRLQNSGLKNQLEYKINYFETEKISFSKELSKKNEELANILKKLSRQELLSKQYKDQLSKKEKEIQVLNKKVKEENEKQFKKPYTNITKSNIQSVSQKDNLEIIQLAKVKKQLKILQKKIEDLNSTNGQQKEIIQRKNISDLKLQQRYITDPYLVYFQGEVFEGRFATQKPFLVNSIEKMMESSIISTKLLYSYKLMKSMNPHEFIDNRKNMAIVIRTQHQVILAAFYAGKIVQKELLREKAMIMQVTNQKEFPFVYDEKKKQNKVAVQYDKYFIIFGKAELRIKSGEKTLFSNLGVAASFYESNKYKIEDFLNCKDKREVQMVTYECYQIDFEEEEESKK